MIKDKYGKEINVGDRFSYQAGTLHERCATLKDVDGVATIEWDDETETIPLGDFWYKTDSKLTIKI